MIFVAPEALLSEGWRREVAFTIDSGGRFTHIEPEARPDGAKRLPGPVLPGFANVHCHAFQRALVGRTHVAGPREDSFWTWREALYDLVAKLREEDLAAIAAQAYVEQLKGGFTTVCEFHYLHDGASGEATSSPPRNAQAILAAAREAGIALTLLPALYQDSGFGGERLSARQERFRSDVESILRLVEDLCALGRGDDLLRVGAAAHSLRAVPPAALAALVQGLRALDADAPIHMHVAEQRAEVEACLAALRQRPVAWLLDHAPVDERWCLVHATHLLREECAALARSGAVAGLCPSTEGDLGDGFFPLRDFLQAGGRFGMGTDSNLCASAFEELRWLEYGQRLLHEKRNIAAAAPGRSTGEALVRAALEGGARASGQPTGSLQLGKRADFLVLDPAHPALLGLDSVYWLDALVFSSVGKPPVLEVYLAGRAVIQGGRHPHEEGIAGAFASAIRRLAH